VRTWSADSDLKTGMLRNKSLRRMRISAEIRSQPRKPLSKCKFANHTRFRRSDLHKVTQILFGRLGWLLTFFRRCSAASWPTVAIGTAAAVLHQMAVRFSDWTIRYRAWCTESPPDKAQRKAGHQKPSEVAGCRSHGTIIAQ
jgi:hypothetical protein